MKSKKGVFLVVSLFFSQIMFCGFSTETLIRVNDGYVSIGQLEVGDRVICSDLQKNCLEKKITKKRQCKREDCLCLVIGQVEIITSHNQKFFLADEHVWELAKNLIVGDILLNSNGDGVEVQKIIELGKTDLFDITVDLHHNFFVSENELLVHNFAAVAAVGAAEIIGGIATGVAAIAGLKSSSDSGEFAVEKKKKATKDSGKNVTGESEEESRETGAQAPGEPTEKDKFKPKKGWDRKKVKVQKGPLKGKAGYPDKDGNIWVPTGPKGHGGPEWDVQNPKTGKNTNVYPGGKIRGKDNRK